jgi:AraC family transcriptional regulator
MKRQGTPESLSSGETYGQTEVRTRTAGFVISVMRPVLPPEEVPVHTHPEGSFTFILSGFQISSANKEPCGPGALIYNPPGTTHRDRFQSVEKGKFLHISIADEITESLALPKAPTHLRRHEALGFARAIARECLTWDERSPQFAEGLCFQLLADTGQIQDGRRTGSVPAWLTEAQELLTESCTEPVSISKVARTVGVHPAHLARNFSRFFKRSPGEHLRRYRIATAAELLLETDLPLAEIALACGFADQSHLTHLFKRQKGLSPAAYRTRVRASRPSK